MAFRTACWRLRTLDQGNTPRRERVALGDGRAGYRASRLVIRPATDFDLVRPSYQFFEEPSQTAGVFGPGGTCTALMPADDEMLT